MHLREIKLDKHKFGDSYFFTVSTIRAMDSLVLNRAVTIFVGENGTGKSTLLESLAVASDSIVLGNQETLTAAGSLAACLRLVWQVKTHRGFFLSAQDFIDFSRTVDGQRADLRARLEELEDEYRHRTQHALNLARMPLVGQLQEMEALYGQGLERLSHGESFLHFFQRRLAPGGLYLLDEPETPLSPVKQLTLIALITDAVEQDCQFIIATHSPILMAIPGAEILSFDAQPPALKDYEELEHVNITRDFLNNPQSFLRHIE